MRNILVCLYIGDTSPAEAVKRWEDINRLWTRQSFEDAENIFNSKTNVTILTEEHLKDCDLSSFVSYVAMLANVDCVYFTRQWEKSKHFTIINEICEAYEHRASYELPIFERFVRRDSQNKAKPVFCDAVRYTDDNFEEIKHWLAGYGYLVVKYNASDASFRRQHVDSKRSRRVEVGDYLYEIEFEDIYVVAQKAFESRFKPVSNET
jgi:hypothetical protein